MLIPIGGILIGEHALRLMVRGVQVPLIIIIFATIHANWKGLVYRIAMIPSLLYNKWNAKETAVLGKFISASALLLLFSYFVYFTAHVPYQVRYSIDMGLYALEDDLSDVLLWMDKELEPDSVILSFDYDTQLLIPAHTSSNTFFPHSVFSTISRDETLSRYVVALKYLGIGKIIYEEILASYYDNPRDSGLWMSQPRNRVDFIAVAFWEEIVNLQWGENIRLLNERTERRLIKPLLKAYDVAKASDIDKYRLDYILLHRDEMSLLSNTHLVEQDVIFQNSQYFLYRYMAPNST
jgi:hypothetical protein